MKTQQFALLMTEENEGTLIDKKDLILDEGGELYAFFDGFPTSSGNVVIPFPTVQSDYIDLITTKIDDYTYKVVQLDGVLLKTDMYLRVFQDVDHYPANGGMLLDKTGLKMMNLFMTTESSQTEVKEEIDFNELPF